MVWSGLDYVNWGAKGVLSFIYEKRKFHSVNINPHYEQTNHNTEHKYSISHHQSNFAFD